MSGSDYSLDFKDFNAKMEKYKNLVMQEAAPEGVRQGCDQMVLDACNIYPRVPHLHGALEGSGKVDSVEREGDAIVGQVSFGGEAGGVDAPYAARWHELPPGEASKINWTRSGSGSKYLESKLAWFKEKYIDIIANVIRKRTG